MIDQKTPEEIPPRWYCVGANGMATLCADDADALTTAAEAEAGLQARHGETWVPLAPAEGFCRVLDTGKRRGDGTMVQQIKWAESVLNLVQREAA